MDRKINTLFEKRALQISKDQIAKSQVRLIDRNYYFGAFDPVTNKLTGGRRIFFNGTIVQLARIDKQDVNMVANAPDADAMEASGPRQELDGDGAQQGMVTKTQHGRRFTDLIKITGFTVNLKVLYDRFPTLVDAGGGTEQEAWFARTANGAYVRDLMETIVLKWRLCQVTDAQAAVDPAIQAHPTCLNLVPFRSFGYSASLDDDEKSQTLFLKKRTLYKGSTSYQVRERLSKDKTINHYVRLKNPITVKYSPVDQNGRQTVAKRFYFAIRSNVPHEAGTQNIDHSQFAPRIHVCLKTHYTE